MGKKYMEGFIPDVKFEDLQGQKEVSSELVATVSYIKALKEHEYDVVKDVSGFTNFILLYGPSGSGKTKLCYATANYLNIPVFEVLNYEAQKDYLGKDVELLVDLYENAKKKAPSIIYIDELDDYLRSVESAEALSYMFLSMLREKDPEHPVLFIATTNEPRSIIPSIADRANTIYCPAPGAEDIFGFTAELCKKFNIPTNKEEVQTFTYLASRMGLDYRSIKGAFDIISQKLLHTPDRSKAFVRWQNMFEEIGSGALQTALAIYEGEYIMQEKIKTDPDQLPEGGLKKALIPMNSSVAGKISEWVAFFDDSKSDSKEPSSSELSFSTTEDGAILVEGMEDFAEVTTNSVMYGGVIIGYPGVGKNFLSKCLAKEVSATHFSLNFSDFIYQMGDDKGNVHIGFPSENKEASLRSFTDRLLAGIQNTQGNKIVYLERVDYCIRVVPGFLKSFMDSLSHMSDSGRILVLSGFDCNYVPEQNLYMNGIGPDAIRDLGGLFTLMPMDTDEIETILSTSMEADMDKDDDISDSIQVMAQLFGNEPITGTYGHLLKFIDMCQTNYNKPFSKISVKEILEYFYEKTGGYKTEEDRDDERTWEVACHEAGHAFLNYNGREYGVKSPILATIIARSNYGGFVAYDRESIFQATEAGMRARIRCALAGRAAEQVLVYDDQRKTVGLGSDIQQASNTALELVSLYAMTDKYFVPRTFKRKRGVLDSSGINPLWEKELFDEADKVLKDEMKNTQKIIADNKEAVIAIAKALVEREILTRREIENIIEEHK